MLFRSHANEEKLEAFLLDNFESILAQYTIQSESPQTRTKARNDAQRIQGKMERLRELYIEGDIDRASYNARAAALAAPPNTGPRWRSSARAKGSSSRRTAARCSAISGIIPWTSSPCTATGTWMKSAFWTEMEKLIIIHSICHC